MTPADAAAKVREIAALLRLDAVRIIALERHFDCGNTQAIMDTLSKAKEGHAVRLIRGAAIEAIALACTRACDKGDSTSNRHSIPVAKDLLLDSRTFGLVAASDGNADALNHFLRMADEISKSYAHGRLRVLRDVKVAHHLPKQFADTETPQLNHLWDALESVLQAIYQLSVGTGVNLVSLDAEAKVWTERCEAYWRRLMEGPPNVGPE